MKLVATEDREDGFAVVHGTATSQAAVMTLAPGEDSSEDMANEHAWAEQWLYVVSGVGEARFGKRRIKLRVGSLLLVERGEAHQIHNAGKTPLVTVNIYVPPAYSPDGEPLY
ncbi:MAG TPA: cupin domain-containing protein [Kofleriaceae bacterium]|jgi:mannose-6-phosphate isomerase-like protein (cupin superfamily)